MDSPLIVAAFHSNEEPSFEYPTEIAPSEIPSEQQSPLAYIGGVKTLHRTIVVGWRREFKQLIQLLSHGLSHSNAISRSIETLALVWRKVFNGNRYD